MANLRPLSEIPQSVMSQHRASIHWLSHQGAVHSTYRRQSHGMVRARVTEVKKSMWRPLHVCRSDLNGKFRTRLGRKHKAENDRRGVQRRGLGPRVCKGSVMACGPTRMWRLNPAVILVYMWTLTDRACPQATCCGVKLATFCGFQGVGLWRCSGVLCALPEK